MADVIRIRQAPVVHELKCWKGFFEDMLNGKKTFDVRRDDRHYHVGDVLRQLEYWPNADEVGGTYTGREIRQRVDYVMRGPQLGLERGWVVMSVTTIAVVQ